MNYNHVIIIILYVKWVESVGVSKGVWFVPTFIFEKLATMCLAAASYIIIIIMLPSISR